MFGRWVWSVSWLCEVLEVSRSGFHAWLSCPLSDRALLDAKLVAAIYKCFKASDRTYGARRIGPGGGDSAPTGADEAPDASPPQDVPAATDAAPTTRTPRTGTKQAMLIAMFRAEGGAMSGAPKK